MTNALPFRPKARQGESVRGFLLRTSEANLYESSSWIKELPIEVGRLRKMTGGLLHGRVPSWLRNGGYRLSSSDCISHQHLLGQRARCCPECLREINYWPARWEHIFYTACHRHGRLLVDRCSQCQFTLTWSRPQLMHCRCGSSIRDWPLGEIISDEERALCAGVARSMSRETQCTLEPGELTELEKLLEEVSLNQLSRLIFILGGYSAVGNDPKRRGNHRVMEIETAHMLVNAAARMLSDWPSRFCDFLLKVGGYTEPMSIRHECPSRFLMFGRALRVECKAPALKFVATAYENFVMENWRGVLNRRHKWANAKQLQGQPNMSAAVVARTLRISRGRVKELVNQKILRGYVKHTKSQREYFVIERASLIGAEDHMNDHVTFSGAAMLLGLPKGRVTELITAQLLTEIVDVPKAGYIRLFSRTEIATFVKRLSAFGRESEEENLLSGAVILKTHLASASEFISLIRDIFSGRLPVIKLKPQTPGFNGLIFGREEFYAWRANIRTDSKDISLTVVEAATHLGVKQEVAYHLVRCGILVSSERRVGKRNCRLVSLSDIEKFEATYISSARLALIAKTSPKAIVEKLCALGISAIVGPDIDLCRQYFFVRKDVGSYTRTDGVR
jgi:hypothetical protein